MGLSVTHSKKGDDTMGTIGTMVDYSMKTSRIATQIRTVHCESQNQDFGGFQPSLLVLARHSFGSQAPHSSGNSTEPTCSHACRGSMPAVFCKNMMRCPHFSPSASAFQASSRQVGHSQ